MQTPASNGKKPESNPGLSFRFTSARQILRVTEFAA
jgi:hypothetical protein